MMIPKLRKYARAALLSLAIPLAACATGPTFEQMHASEPALAQGQGRIYFYRPIPMLGQGTAIQPSIMVNGVKVGDPVPGGYFYIDRPPGPYDITTTTETEEHVHLTLPADQMRYIRFDISMGLLIGHVAPSIIDPEQALSELRGLHYIGPK